jgi:hypothetical protein
MNRALLQILAFATFLGTASAAPVITEFMAGNSTTLEDGDGGFSDWIEIYNPGDAPIDLSSYSLTDGDGVWTIPVGVEIAPNGYLTVFASQATESAYRDGSGALHATFALALEGEPLQLMAPGGTIVVSGFENYPPQRRDVSYGIDPASGGVKFFMSPTPGAANGAGVAGFVEQVAFSVAHGFKDEAFDLALTTPTVGAEIFYSLDGSNPASVKVSQTLIESTMVAEDAALAAYVPVDAADGIQSGGKSWTDPDFVEPDGWIAGAGPVGFDSTIVPGDYTELIGLDLGDQMRSRSATALVRIPFDLTESEATGVDFLTLSVKYDDGFVAYINGVKVAEANAPAELDGASTATTSHRDTEAVVFEEFDAAAGISALRAGPNVLAVHALNSSVTGSDFLNSVQLTAARYESVAISGVPYTKPLQIDGTATVRAFAKKDGFADSPATTRTYLFGSDVIRQPENPEGFPDTWGEFTGTNGSRRGAPVPADYEMKPSIVNEDPAGMIETLKSLPSISIVADPDDLFGTEGILSNPFAGIDGRTGVFTIKPFVRDRHCSVEWIDPNGGPELQLDCGIRLSGGWSRHYIASPKKSFSLLFKEEFGPGKLRFKVFPDSDVDKFDRIILKAIFSNAWPDAARPPDYLRDHFLRKTRSDMGEPASHGTWVHLYLNGLYWGIFNPTERPDASYAASHFGGSKEDYDAVKHKGLTGPGGASNDSFEVIDGEGDAWLEAQTLARADLSEPEHYEAFRRYVDVKNLADYSIINTYTANADWPHKNWYANRRRADGAGWRFYSWDSEYALHDTRLDRTSASNRNTPAYLYSRARKNPEFRLLFADRVHKHLFNGGALTPEVNKERYSALAAIIEPAINGEAARWGDNGFTRQGRTNYTKSRWESARDGVLRFFDRRHDTALTQYRRADLYPDIEAPVFSQHGGDVSAGFQLEMTLPDGEVGQIYYTLDGSDPRVPQLGSEQPEELFVKENAPLSLQIPQSANDGFVADGKLWTDPDFAESATWLKGSGPVGFEGTPGGFNDFVNVNLEEQMRSISPSVLLRIPFELAEAALDDINFLKLRMKYDDGFIAYVNGVEVAQANAPANRDGTVPATTSHRDSEAEVFEEFDASAGVASLNPGRNLLAIQGFNASITGSDFLIGAELAGGKDLTISPSAVAYTGPATLTTSTTVKARLLKDEEWSALNEAYFQVGAEAASANNVVVSRIHYRPSAPSAAEAAMGHTNRSDFEYLQLMNIGATRVSLDGATFADGVTFDFGSGAGNQLEPGGTLLVVENREAFTIRFGTGRAIAGQYSGKLSDNGETIQLLSANGEAIAEFSYDDNEPWPVLADGDGLALGLVAPETKPDPKSGSNWQAVAADPSGTPGIVLADWMAVNGFTDPDADDTGTGVSNLIAFALGYDLSPFAPSIRRTGGESVFMWQIRTESSDVTVTAEHTTDLSTWTEAAPGALTTETRAHGVSLVRFSMPLGSEGYVRLRISGTP